MALSKPVKFMDLNFNDNVPHGEKLFTDKFEFET